MDALDDVASLAKLAQSGLGILDHHPLARADLIGEAQSLQLAQPSDFQDVKLVRLAIRARSEIDDACPIRVTRELPVEVGPALRLDLTFEVAPDLLIRAWAQLLRHEILCASTHAFLDVVARDDEILAVVGAAAQDDVDVGIVGVPMINAHPVQLGAEVLLHLVHQVAGEDLEVRHLGRILGRDDEAEVVAIVLATLGKLLGIQVVAAGSEETGLLPIPGHAFAAEIAEVCCKRRRARRMANDAGLDDRDARTAGEQTVRLYGRAAATSEARSRAGADVARA